MKVGDLAAVPGRRRDEGWDETVFVWNGTVARIAVAVLEPDSAGDVAGVEVKPRLILDRDVDRNAPRHARLGRSRSHGATFPRGSATHGTQ